MSGLIHNAGFVFTVEEMKLAGEKSKHDALMFRRHGPRALDAISLTATEAPRVFAMMEVYYHFPGFMLPPQQARAV
jgi:hypothetical protein